MAAKAQPTKQTQAGNCDSATVSRNIQTALNFKRQYVDTYNI